jgi:hypothetical protein
MKRLLIEIAIIATVIAFAWNKPYAEWVGHTAYKVNSTLDEMGGNIQQHEDPSVKRYQTGR